MGQYVSSHGDVISHVNISSIQLKDGGTYRCTAHNTAGSLSHSARLNIYGSPYVRPMGSLSAIAGESLIITCPVAGHPIEKITWKKGRDIVIFSYFVVVYTTHKFFGFSQNFCLKFL